MSDSLAATQPEATADIVAGAPAPPRTWVRWVAFVVLALALVALVALIANYVRSPHLFEAAPDSPRVAAVIVAGVVVLMALAVVIFHPEGGVLRALISTSWAQPSVPLPPAR